MLAWLNLDQRVFKNFNYLLMIQLLPLFFISSWLIYEINPALFMKQMIYYLVAMIVFMGAVITPWRLILWWFAPVFYVGVLLLLLAVDIFGISILGAQRWLVIPGVGLTIQPSEFMKIAVLMMLGTIIYKNPPPAEGYGIKMFAILSALILLPFVLIAKEPDLGTAMVLLLVGFGVLFMVGIEKKILIALAILVVTTAPVMYKYGLKDYQKERIVDAVSSPSYHVEQSLIAIGSGGFSGQTKDESTQTQMKFLPISSSDFIFAYLGERFGMLGMGGVLILYILLILHLFYISTKEFIDGLERVFAAGISWLFFVYMGVNVYMVIGMAPVVGIPLPMFSHGGTSFIVFAFLFGVLQNLLAFKYYLGYNSDAKISLTKKDF
jgi:rod shape determining protein RodA